MSFKYLLDDLQIEFGVKAQTKSEVIENLVSLMASQTFLDKQTLVNKLLDREKMRSSLGRGTAYPHLVTEAAPFLLGAVVVLSQPVEWEKGQSIDIAVAVIGPGRALKEYMKSISTFGRFFSHETHRAAFLKCKTPAEARNLVKGVASEWSKYKPD